MRFRHWIVMGVAFFCFQNSYAEDGGKPAIDSRIELRVGQKRRLPLAHVAGATLQGDGVCRIAQDPLSGAYYLEGVRTGSTLLWIEGRNSPLTQRVRVVVSARKALVRKGTKRSSVAPSPIHLPGWSVEP